MRKKVGNVHAYDWFVASSAFYPTLGLAYLGGLLRASRLANTSSRGREEVVLA